MRSDHAPGDAFLDAIYRVGDARGGVSFTFARSRTSAAVALPFGSPWAIVTAWNPMSERRPLAENRRNHQRLVDAVAGLGLRTSPSVSSDRHTPPGWVEEGLLIEGIDIPATTQLLRAFRQRAAVYAEGSRVGLLFADSGRWEVHPVQIVKETTTRRG